MIKKRALAASREAYIECPFCGVKSPAFDYAHVCLTGPYALKMPEPDYTPEEEEAWKELEKKNDNL